MCTHAHTHAHTYIYSSCSLSLEDADWCRHPASSCGLFRRISLSTLPVTRKSSHRSCQPLLSSLSFLFFFFLAIYHLFSTWCNGLVVATMALQQTDVSLMRWLKAEMPTRCNCIIIIARFLLKLLEIFLQGGLGDPMEELGDSLSWLVLFVKREQTGNASSQWCQASHHMWYLGAPHLWTPKPCSPHCSPLCLKPSFRLPKAIIIPEQVPQLRGNKK